VKILVVDDERAVGESLRRALELQGYEVELAEDGAQALARLGANGQPDAVVLDILMPGIDGLEVCREIRRSGSAVPVLMLTARDAIGDRVEGLDAGADDYLVKPFNLDELSARIRALLRRQRDKATPVITHGGLRVDPATHSVDLSGQPVRLSAREFSLLCALLEHPGKPLSRAQLEERVYGWDEEVDSNAIEVHIHALRKKLGAEWILNLRGVGYYVPELR
jgi:two-component system, OmpR family, response regulator QseB